MSTRTAQRLLDLWHTRIHPAASREQVAIAFSLLAGGLALGLLGVIAVASGDLVFGKASWLRELGIVAAASGLPMFLLGLVAALPARLWLRALAASGTVFVAGGLSLFVWWYPDQWAATFRAPNGFAVSAYVLGVSMLAAGACACVASYFVQRATRAGGPAAWSGDRPVTREEIEGDLAWADRQGWSWGGIRKGQPDVRIVLKESLEPLQLKGRGKAVRLLGTPSSEPDLKAAAALGHLRGQSTRPLTDSIVDKQVGFLRQLHAKKAAAETARRQTWWWRITHPFSH